MKPIPVDRLEKIDRMLSEGMCAPEIAKALGLSYWQVRRSEVRLRNRLPAPVKVRYEDDPMAVRNGY